MCCVDEWFTRLYDALTYAMDGDDATLIIECGKTVTKNAYLDNEI